MNNDTQQPNPAVEDVDAQTDTGATETTPVEQTAEDTTATRPARRKLHLGKKQLALVLVLLAAIGGGLVYWFVLRDTAPTDCCAQPTVSENKQPEPVEDEALARFIKPTTGETWLDTPKVIASQGFLEYEDEYVKYYEVGSRAGNKIIMSVSCPLGCISLLYEVSPQGEVTFVSRPDTQATYNADEEQQNQSMFVPGKVTIDQKQSYDSLSIPRSIAVDDKYVVSKPSYNSLGDFVGADVQDKNAKLSDVKTYGQSKIIKSERSYTDTGLTSLGYAVQLPINTIVWMNMEPTPTSLKGYQWNAGSSTEDNIKAIARGCGGANASITRSDTLKAADVRAIGKNPAGEDVYELSSSDNPLVTKAYEEFKEYVKTDENAAYRDITKEDFVKEHGVVVFKDKYGQYLVYVREQLSPAYGCAKPVVYLYPTTPTLVDVRVGADVKLSEPLYPATTGWQDVLAQPNGQLAYQGVRYDSLFWEGPGYGQYPAITSGTVVRRENALATIRDQLAQQGLNQREIDDFIQYWSDKLPNKPYIRLSWLTTEQLNQLAPLRISPKPDTVIRVFLDFAGLEQPIDLPPQQFTAPARRGFTVTEWGGLSPYKLY